MKSISDEVEEIVIDIGYEANQWIQWGKDQHIDWENKAKQAILNLIERLVDEQYRLSIKEESLPPEHRHGTKWFLYNITAQLKKGKE